nr:MAG TPA: hypothetical protein [Caudoviricetes sp.]
MRLKQATLSETSSATGYTIRLSSRTKKRPPSLSGWSG